MNIFFKKKTQITRMDLLKMMDVSRQNNKKKRYLLSLNRRSSLNEKKTFTVIIFTADYNAIHVDRVREREKKQSRLFEMGCLICNYFDS